jgi:hypothetical protein
MATLVGALRAIHASFQSGQRRFAEGLPKLVKGKVKKMRLFRGICGLKPYKEV